MSKDNGGPASDRELLEMAAKAAVINKWDDGYPDWKDSGRLVTILIDGKETTGVLCYDDWVSDGDGDEFPLWLVRVPGAPYECFAAADKWRFEVIVVAQAAAIGSAM